MVSSLLGMGAVFLIIGIGIRLASGLATSNPFDGLLTVAPTDLPIDVQKSSHWFFSFLSSWIFLSGIIFIIAGIVQSKKR